MRHLMSPLDFTVEELDEILDLADDIEANPEKYAPFYINTIMSIYRFIKM